MKYTLLIFALTFIFKLHGQTKELKERAYPNGQISSRFYDTCYTYIYKGNQNTNCNTIGLSEHWFENGSKQSEIFYDKDGAHYINMWLQNGQQIIENGIGIYYQIEGGGMDTNRDSLVFQITKGIKHGNFNRYRSYKNSTYFWVESGQYENKKKVGLWTFRDSTLNIYDQAYYNDDHKNGKYNLFYLNGMLKEEGQNVNGQEDGLWKYYSENGKLIKECGFKSGREFGEYIEYYSNGKPKISGQYIQISGIETIYVEKAEDPGEIIKEKIKSNNIVAMDGEWKFYNESGQLTKTKIYKKKVKKN